MNPFLLIYQFITDFVNWSLSVEQYLHTLDPQIGGMIYSHCFFAESCGIWGLILILINSLFSPRSDWKTETFNYHIWSFLFVIVFMMIVTLTISEGAYYYKGTYLYTYYYPTSRFWTTPILLLGKYLVLIFTLICLRLHKTYFVTVGQNWEYTIVILCMTISMLLTISANDFFIAFITLEIQSLALFVFLSFRKHSSMAIEAALKYFMFTAFSACLLIYGISLLYAEFGSLNFQILSSLIASAKISGDLNAIIILGITAILAALCIKLTLVPFQWWVGDVYQGAYHFIISYITIVTKIPIIFLLLKIGYGPFFAIADYWLIPVILISVGSIVYGTFYSLTEYNFKRFWAYSSVSHMGYISITLLTGTEGMTNSIIYLIIYLLSNVFIWAFVLHAYKLGTKNTEFKDFLITMFEFASIRKWNKKLSFIFSLIILSLAGMPVGLGFLPKALIIYDLYNINNLLPFIIVIIANIISFAYYLRIIRLISFNVDPNKKLILAPFPRTILWIMVLVFMINNFFYFFFVQEVINFITLLGI